MAERTEERTEERIWVSPGEAFRGRRKSDLATVRTDCIHRHNQGEEDKLAWFRREMAAALLEVPQAEWVARPAQRAELQAQPEQLDLLHWAGKCRYMAFGRTSLHQLAAAKSAHLDRCQFEDWQCWLAS